MMSRSVGTIDENEAVGSEINATLVALMCVFGQVIFRITSDFPTSNFASFCKDIQISSSGTERSFVL